MSATGKNSKKAILLLGSKQNQLSVDFGLEKSPLLFFQFLKSPVQGLER